MVKNACVAIIPAITAAAFCAAFHVGKAYGLAESTMAEGSAAKAVHALGEIGEGVAVGLISQGNVRADHEAFYDKGPDGGPVGSSNVFNYDFSGDGISIINHDTWVAGIVASRGGVNHPNDIGVAPGARIHSARVAADDENVALTALEAALYELVRMRNCRAIVTVIQLSDTPNGQSQHTLLYDYYAYRHNVILANAAGNSGSEVAIVGDAFNSITTGGLILSDSNDEYVYRMVGAETGSGPTADGRRKPDVMAPSQGQTVPSGASDNNWIRWSRNDGATSFSAPHTAGVAALLVSSADKTPEPDDDRNEVIRAVIVNSTFPNIDDKAGNSTNPAEAGNVWHRDRGYGRLDALRAYELLGSGRIEQGHDTTQRRGWAFGTIDMYERQRYRVSAKKWDRLVLTVTWNRRINKVGSRYSQETPPKFNLALRVKDPGQMVVFSETDTLNNLKKIDVLLEQDGVYEIEVENTSIKRTRNYGLAYELIEPIEGDFGPTDYIVDENDLGVLASEWLSEGGESESDLVADGIVNLHDFSEFARRWLDTNPAYWHE